MRRKSNTCLLKFNFSNFGLNGRQSEKPTNSIEALPCRLPSEIEITSNSGFFAIHTISCFLVVVDHNQTNFLFPQIRKHFHSSFVLDFFFLFGCWLVCACFSFVLISYYGSWGKRVVCIFRIYLLMLTYVKVKKNERLARTQERKGKT